MLALETSGPLGGVALWEAESHRGLEAGLSQPFRHAEDLPDRIQSLLAEAGVGFSHLALVAVVRGPGYFTALRVGLSYAKALWLAHRVPLVAPTSLEVLASAADPDADLVVPVINAQRQQVYYAVYRQGRRVAGPGVASPRDLADRYARALFLGPGLALFSGVSLQHRGSEADPAPLAVARLGWQQFQRSGAVDAITLDPLYIREPDAVRRR